VGALAEGRHQACPYYDERTNTATDIDLMDYH
jgi:hypothetical protein